MPKRTREWLFGWRCSLAPGKARVRRTSRGFLYQFFLRLESGKTYGSVMPLFQKDGCCRPHKCVCADGGMVDATGSNPVVREGVWVQVPLGAPKNPQVDFSKKIWYNIYRKIKKDTNSNLTFIILDLKYVSCVYGPVDKRPKSPAFQAGVGGFESPQGHQRLLISSAQR